MKKLKGKSAFVNVLGVRVDGVESKKVLPLVERWLKSNKKYQIVTPNPEQVVLAQKNRRLKEVLNQADLSIIDGIGLSWAINFYRQGTVPVQGQSLALWKRIGGVDLMLALCQEASKKGWRVFLLGAKPGVAKKTAEKLHFLKLARPVHKNFKIAFDQGAKDIKKESGQERKNVIDKINRFKPDLLFVAYGAPLQEIWIADNLGKLNVKVAMGVGGAFDYISGQVKRAPLWMRKIGLEWLYRLIKQPWRLGRQMALLKFIWLIIKNNLKAKKIEN